MTLIGIPFISSSAPNLSSSSFANAHEMPVVREHFAFLLLMQFSLASANEGVGASGLRRAFPLIGHVDQDPEVIRVH
jgi:hypothetical protein